MSTTTAASFVDSSGETRLVGSLVTDGSSTGNQTITGTLHVTGATTLDSTLAAAGTTVTTLHATGAATLDSTLAVGAVTATAVTTSGSGAVTAGGALNIGAALNHDGTTIGFFTAAPTTKQAVTGALSTVLDAPAKAVLTSIIAALVAYGLVTDSTT